MTVDVDKCVPLLPWEGQSNYLASSIIAGRQWAAENHAKSNYNNIESATNFRALNAEHSLRRLWGI